MDSFIGNLYTVDDVADMLSLSKSTVRRYLKERKLGYIQPTAGGKILIPAAEIEHFLDESYTEERR